MAHWVIPRPKYVEEIECLSGIQVTRLQIWGFHISLGLSSVHLISSVCQVGTWGAYAVHPSRGRGTSHPHLRVDGGGSRDHLESLPCVWEESGINTCPTSENI